MKKYFIPYKVTCIKEKMERKDINIYLSIIALPRTFDPSKKTFLLKRNAS
jgi:hypothetical protein